MIPTCLLTIIKCSVEVYFAISGFSPKKPQSLQNDFLIRFCSPVIRNTNSDSAKQMEIEHQKKNKTTTASNQQNGKMERTKCDVLAVNIFIAVWWMLFQFDCIKDDLSVAKVLRELT